MGLNWYKRDPDRALNGMRGLSHDEKSAYGTIIDLSYSRNGVLPDDEHLLCVHIECRPQWWRRVRAALIAKGKIRIVLQEVGDTKQSCIQANRVETTLKEAANFSETQAKRARNGWELRRKHSKNNGATMPPGNANTTTSTEREEENSSREFSSSLSGVDRADAQSLARSPDGSRAPSRPNGPPQKPTPTFQWPSDEELDKWCKEQLKPFR